MSEHSIVKHIAPPATAAQIAQAVGVTEEDRRAVDKVLRDLGYLAEERGRTRASKPSRGKSPAPRFASRRTI
jgi:hypothetical protein